MTNLSIVDPSFDIQVTSSYYMSIQANLNGLSFCVLDPVTNKYILFHHHNFPKSDANQHQLEELLVNNPYLNLSYKKVFCLLPTSHYTLVPSPLYSEDQNRDLLAFSGHLPSENQTIAINKIKMADAVNLFYLPEALLQLVRKQFTEVKFYQQCTPLIESLLSKKISGRDCLMHLHFQQGYFEVIVIRNHKLVLCNTFKFTDEKEMLYLILFVYEQLGLTYDGTAVEVSGTMEKTSQGFLLLKKYLKQTERVSLPVHFQFSDSIKQIHPEQFTNLFNLPLCE